MDSAVLSGGSSPTGTLTFSLHAPGGAVVDTETVTVLGDGAYATPTGFTLPTVSTAVGTYEWDVSYSGDSNNNGVSATGEQVVVSPASPALTTSPSPTTLSSPGLVTDSATLSGGYFETGTLTFTLHAPGGAVVDTETVTVLGNGTYTTPSGFTPSTSGTYQWDASYSGDGNNSPVADNTDPQEHVVAVGPTLSTSPSPAAVVLGTTAPTLTDSAVLSGGSSPTGTLTFSLHAPGGAVVDTETVTVLGDGTYATPTGFTLPTGSTVTGTYQWDVSYSGDTTNFSVGDTNGPAEQVVVTPASPVLTTSPSPTTLSSPGLVTDSATLSGGYFETGTLTFTLHAPGGAVLDTETVTVLGNGTYTTPTGFTPATNGTYQWDASYSGDPNNSPVSDSNDPQERVVLAQGADLGITQSASPNPVFTGKRLTYKINVANHGPEGATGVTVVDQLPAGVRFDSAATSQGTCTLSDATKHSHMGGTVTCRVGSLSDGSSAQITIVVRAGAPGMLTNHATVTGDQPDPDPANNSSSITTVGQRAI